MAREGLRGRGRGKGEASQMPLVGSKMAHLDGR